MTLRLALLAAGCARRYGDNKLLAVHPASQQPLLHHVISEYQKAGITDITVLTGYWHNAISENLPSGVTHQYVDDWQEGMAASVRAAAAACLSGGAWNRWRAGHITWTRRNARRRVHSTETPATR